MSKKILILTMIIMGTSLFAAPADNFKAAGIGLGGNVSFYNSQDNFLNDNDSEKTSYTSLNVRPNFEFLIVDNLSISMQPYLSYSNYTYYDRETNPNISIGLDLGANYYLTNVGEIIPFGGIFFGIGNTAQLEETSGDDSVEDKATEFTYNYGFKLGSLYFISEHVALNLLGTFTFSGSKAINNSNGDKVEYSDDYDAMDDLDMATNIYVGVSVFLPYNSKVLLSDL